jgi:pimeloyl-ACP methyl ester carboxylesterase
MSGIAPLPEAPEADPSDAGFPERLAGISGAELVVLAESGHFGHLEEPAAVRDAVLRHRGAVTGTTGGRST